MLAISLSNPYSPLYGGFFHCCPLYGYKMYSITFQPPYANGEWKIETYRTKEQAESMIQFYSTCGTKAYFVADEDYYASIA